MNIYDLFSKYFDELMVNPVNKVERIEKYIIEYFPQAESILDIACGTGSILNGLSNKYDKFGIDLSEKMLEFAKKKVKGGKFFQDHMLSFNFTRKFDIILCIYDSINHLLTFQDWEKFFKQVKQHLNKNGLFIFDINTLYRLKTLSKSFCHLHQFGTNKKNYYCLSVSQIKTNIFNWSVKIFEHQNQNTYLLIEENILESTFSLKKIKRILEKEFTVLSIEDNNGENPFHYSERVWFICKV